MSKIFHSPWTSAILVAAAALFLPLEVLAQDAPPSAAISNASNIGGMLSSVRSNVAPMVVLCVVSAVIFGAILVFSGLMKLKDGEGERGAVIDGICRIGGGAFLTYLPSAMGVGVGTLFGGAASTSPVYIMSGAKAGAVKSCALANNTNAISCMLDNLKINVVPVGMDLLYFLMMAWGAYMMFGSIYKMAKSKSQGGPPPQGNWLFTFIIGSLLVNMPRLMLSVQETLGIASGVLSTSTGFVGVGSSLLKYGGSSAISGMAEYSNVVSGVFAIMPLFGLMAVFRGMAIIRGIADGGNSPKTLGAGITHIAGGVFLANSKWTICLVMNTLTGAGNITGFC